MKTAESILEELKLLTTEEIEQIGHVIRAMRKTKEEGMHYTGRLFGLDFDSNGDMFMDLGMQNANTYGVAQGGAVYTLADVAIGYNIMTKIPEDTEVYTLELKMNYVKPGKGKRLYAKPLISHLGYRTVVCECKVLDDHDELVAIALGTFYLKRPK